LVLALCCIAVVLDGFDTQVIGFAAPALLADWGVTKADLAPALAMGLIGMTVGAVVARQAWPQDHDRRERPGVRCADRRDRDGVERYRACRLAVPGRSPARFRTWLPLSPNLRRQSYVASRCR